MHLESFTLLRPKFHQEISSKIYLLYNYNIFSSPEIHPQDFQCSFSLRFPILWRTPRRPYREAYRSFPRIIFLRNSEKQKNSGDPLATPVLAIRAWLLAFFQPSATQMNAPGNRDATLPDQFNLIGSN